MYKVTLTKVREPCLNPVFSEAYLVVTLIYYAQPSTNIVQGMVFTLAVAYLGQYRAKNTTL